MINVTKTAVVLGATGLVGKALVAQLNQSDEFDKICVIVRKVEKSFETFAKVQQIIVLDFLTLTEADLSTFSHVFSCLGTTLKKAGSKQAFYNIDFSINAHVIDLLKNSDTHYLLISATGADATSRFFYNRVKGQLEDHLQAAKLAKVSIFRPSLLLGERHESRSLEDLSQSVFKSLSRFIPQNFKLKPVTAEQVAHTMVVVAQSQSNPFEIYDNLQIQQTK